MAPFFSILILISLLKISKIRYLLNTYFMEQIKSPRANYTL